MLRPLRTLILVAGLLVPAWLGAQAEDENRNYTLTPLLASEVPPVGVDRASERILEAHIRARGGREALEKISGLLIDGTLTENRADYTVTWQCLTAGQQREDLRREHLGYSYHTVRASDGETGWTISVAPPQKRPAPFPVIELLGVGGRMDLFTPLLHWRHPDFAFQYDGTSVVGGDRVDIIKAKVERGQIVYFYFDQKTHMLRNIGYRTHFLGAMVNVDRVVLGLRKINGVWLETGYSWVVNKREFKRVELERIVTNPGIDPAVFTEPEVPEVWLRKQP